LQENGTRNVGYPSSVPYKEQMVSPYKLGCPTALVGIYGLVREAKNSNSLHFICT
jgi:hypothetical protein